MKVFILSKEELKRMNNNLKDCDDIAEDLERARRAGVPNVEHLEEAVKTCRERIAAIKAVYSKDKA